MIFMVIFVVITIATVVAIFRSKKPLKHILAEAKYDFFYNVMGSRALLEDVANKGKNKINLIKKPGKVALITGGTRGIGAEVIKMLLQCDVHVIMGCRNPEAGAELLKKFRNEDNIKNGEMDVYKLDISDLDNVRKFATIVTDKHSRIHYLINNAGIMYVPYEESVNGYESQFATNYLGHFLLTHLLLDVLKKSGKNEDNARIVNVSSKAYVSGNINFDDINNKAVYIPFQSYAQSKLAQVLFTNYLNEMLTRERYHVQVHAIHPGIVNTELFDTTFLKSLFGCLLKYIFKTPEEGARTIIYACISPDLESKGGTYLSNCTVTPQNEIASDKELQSKFFDYTKKLLDVDIFGKE